MHRPSTSTALAGTLLAWLMAAPAWSAICQARSGATVTPVIELYTSQGCSSCPPADRWLSSFKAGSAESGAAVLQAFHVAYWDYIGWADPFALPVHAQRQRQIAAWNQLRGIYTPQVVANGRDWPGWRSASGRLPQPSGPAVADIALHQRGPDAFEATVTIQNASVPYWTAYWTVTEHGHSTRVRAGENAGEQLRNDHVVRQYTQAGQHRSVAGKPQSLVLHAVAARAGHGRNVNLVVFDPRNGKVLQALTASC